MYQVINAVGHGDFLFEVGFCGVREPVCMVIVEQISRISKYKDDMTCTSPQFSLVLLVIFRWVRDIYGVVRTDWFQLGI